MCAGNSGCVSTARVIVKSENTISTVRVEKIHKKKPHTISSKDPVLKILHQRAVSCNGLRRAVVQRVLGTDDMFIISEIHHPLLRLILAALVLFKLYLMSVVGRCNSRKRMDGKVVIITGANSGEFIETSMFAHGIRRSV